MGLSTAHFECGLPILADLDLGALASGFQAAQAGDLRALQGVLQAFGKAGQLKMLRRLVAVKRATAEHLVETDGVIPELEAVVAAQDFKESLKEAMVFFEQLGLSWSPTVPSSETAATAKKPEKAKKRKAGATPSADS